MTTILILNIVLAILIVGAIVSLLAWGIGTDRSRTPLRRPARSRRPVPRAEPARRPRERRTPAAVRG